MGEKQEHQARRPDVRVGRWTVREGQHGEPPRQKKTEQKTEKYAKSQETGKKKATYLEAGSKRLENSTLKSFYFRNVYSSTFQSFFFIYE